MADKHTASNLDGSTDVSLADAHSITERNNMTLESEKQVEAGQRDVASRDDEHTTVHEPIADEKAAVESALEKADSGDVADEKKIENEDNEEAQIEYPAKWRLALITIALCLSVFCMALVWPILSYAGCTTLTNGNGCRTIPLSQPPFHELQISSTP